jgi:hypothetical protein
MSGEKRKAPTKEEIELRAYQIYLERGCNVAVRMATM